MANSKNHGKGAALFGSAALVSRLAGRKIPYKTEFARRGRRGRKFGAHRPLRKKKARFASGLFLLRVFARALLRPASDVFAFCVCCFMFLRTCPCLEDLRGRSRNADAAFCFARPAVCGARICRAFLRWLCVTALIFARGRTGYRPASRRQGSVAGTGTALRAPRSQGVFAKI